MHVHEFALKIPWAYLFCYSTHRACFVFSLMQYLLVTFHHFSGSTFGGDKQAPSSPTECKGMYSCSWDLKVILFAHVQQVMFDVYSVDYDYYFTVSADNSAVSDLSEFEDHEETLSA